MLHHISIPASDSGHVSEVLAEVWIENRLMLEAVSREMAAAYAQVLQFERLDQHFGMGSVG
ncbi:hypothetical protein ACMDCR_31110 [Labrys okinawensis]|uniref:hypothetical protein n=1 Tax=Labrys okinawensis TaxID=346911 RepID=UPI0039BC6610